MNPVDIDTALGAGFARCVEAEIQRRLPAIQRAALRRMERMILEATKGHPADRKRLRTIFREAAKGAPLLTVGVSR